LLVIITAFLLARRWPSATQIVLMIAFGIVPLFQQRMLLWWFMLVPWLIAPHVKAFLDRQSWPWLHQPGTADLRKTLLAGFLIVIVLLWSPPVQWLFRGGPPPLETVVSRQTPWAIAEQLHTAPEPSTQPELAAALKTYYSEGKYRGSVFGTEVQGDYLFWALPTETPVVIFTHAQAFEPAHWQQCRKVLDGKASWRDHLDDQRVNLLVLESGRFPQLEQRVKEDEDWMILSSAGPSHFVALRRKPL
jgi:hypothetical protein